MTGIEWTEQVWNPTTGCDRVSAGCDRCYAMTMAKRLKGMGQAKYQRDGDSGTSGPGFGLTVHDDVLTVPLKWRKPRRVFVNSMSDLFHKDVPTEFIAKVWAVMELTQRHTYQVLTKRHARMKFLLGSRQFVVDVDDWREHYEPGCGDFTWPRRNVWVGVSVEDQKHADLRIPALLDTPAAVRFLSCEPLIGPVDLSVVYVRNGTLPVAPLGIHYDQDTACGQHPISWVIAGGESGPGARTCNPEWIRSLVKQCGSADVPMFVKQLGSVWARENGWGGKGGDPEQWDSDLRVRQFPTVGVPV